MAIHEKDEALLNLAIERHLITRKQYQFLVQELEMSASKGAAGRTMAAKGFITPEQRVTLEDEVASGVVAPPPSAPSTPPPVSGSPALPPPVPPGTPVAPSAAAESQPSPPVQPHEPIHLRVARNPSASSASSAAPSPPARPPLRPSPIPPSAPSSPLRPLATTPQTPPAKQEVPTLLPSSHEWVLDPSLPLGAALVAARDAGAGDFHWAKGRGATLRYCGQIHPAEGAEVSVRDVQEGLLSHLTPAEQIHLQETGAMRVEALLPDEWRVRFSLVQSGSALTVSARFFPPLPPSTGDLGLPPAIQTGLTFQDGLFLIAGAQRSGRTTTLHSILAERSSARPEPVLRILRSIDYSPSSDNTLTTTWKVRHQVATLLEGLRLAPSFSPSLVVVDDLVSSEECTAALELAEAGLFVLATVQAEYVSTAFARFVETETPEEAGEMAQRFSECVRGILSQRLLPRLDVAGLILVPELLLAVPSALPVLRSGRSNQLETAIRAGRRQGMIGLDDALLDYANRNLIDRQIAAQFAQNKQLFGGSGRAGTGTSPGTPLPSTTSAPSPTAPPNPQY